MSRKNVDLVLQDVAIENAAASNTTSANPEALQEETIQNWMLSTLSVNSVLAESKSVADRRLLQRAISSGYSVMS